MTKKQLMLQYFLKEIDRIDHEIKHMNAVIRFRDNDINMLHELIFAKHELEVTARIYVHIKGIFEILDTDEEFARDKVDLSKNQLDKLINPYFSSKGKI